MTGAQVHVLCGLVAAGKTTLARQLAKELPALRLSRDEWMLRLYGLPYDDPRYIAAIEPCTNLLWDVAIDVLALGTSVVLDWNHWSKERRADARARARSVGADVVVHYLDVPLEVVIERARERRERAPADAHVVDDGGVRHMATILEPPLPSEGMTVVHHRLMGRAQTMTTTLDLAGLQELLAAGQQQQVQLVEVLAAEEYGWAHLPGAINVPLKEIGETVPASIDATRPVVAYCNDFL